MIRAPNSLSPACSWLLAAFPLVAACSKTEPSSERHAPASAPKPSAAQPAGPPLPAPPAALGRLKVPKSNPQTRAKVELGARLFFDPALSADGSRACASCHEKEAGTGGRAALPIGANGVPLPRHAPTLWNVGYLPQLYWDGRESSLEAVASAELAGPLGLGEQRLAAKARELEARPEYRASFDAAFPEQFPGQRATPRALGQALAAYQRSLFCADTALDRYLAGAPGALDAQQKAGLELFTGKAACHSCHTPPFFSDAYLAEDGAYHNVGSGIAGKPPASVDVGRQRLTQSPDDYAAFKTPSLRDVTRSAPYLHDGSMAKLEDVVRFMASGGHKNPALDPKMMDKQLSDAEVAQLVAFLGALDCPGELAPSAL